MGALVEVLGDLDQGLGGHAADPGAGGAGLPAIDEDEGLAGPADLAHGVEAGGPGANDGDINESFFHGEYLDGGLGDGLRRAVSVVFLGRIVRPG
jgi:hypothetical protein